MPSLAVQSRRRATVESSIADWVDGFLIYILSTRRALELPLALVTDVDVGVCNYRLSFDLRILVTLAKPSAAEMKEKFPIHIPHSIHPFRYVLFGHTTNSYGG